MQPGKLVAGRFELEAQAGVGGMGVVWRARDRERDGEQVALKLLHGGLRDAGGRFSREARLLAELTHPGIVRYVASGEAEGTQFLAMEWLDGEDLSQRLARGELDAEESVLVVRQAAEALGVAHARGIVHRDVKPSNLFLVGGRLDAVKVLDLGIAAWSDATRALTAAGAIMGTPGYMSPEQVRSEKTDAPTDVFALGCVLYECLTGRPAFYGQNPLALALKVLAAEPEPLEGIAPALAALCARMLAKDAAARPSDGNKVAAELDALARGTASGSRAPSRRPAPTTSLTPAERRVVSVVVARPERTMEPIEMARTLTDDETTGLLEAIARHGGWLEQVEAAGALMVVTRDAVGGARSALELARRFPAARIGLATGHARRTAALASIGEAIERAAELSMAASPAEPRVDAATASLLGERFVLGGAEAGLWLLEERDLVERPRLLLGKPTPTVGRDVEIATLERLYDECVDEPGARAVLVTAPAGGGKSRVFYEILPRLRARSERPEVWVARGDPSSAGASYGMLAELARRAIGIVQSEPLAVRQKRILARIGQRFDGEAALRIAEFLGELLHARFPDEGRVELENARRDAIVMGDQIQRAFEDFIEAELAAQPVVLVLEDLHWGDAPTVQMIDRLLRNLHDQPLYVLALGRPEVDDLFPKMWSERATTQLRLGRLGKRGARELVRAVLDDRSDLHVEAIIERADGNAFFLEELIRSAAQGSEELPATVMAVVERRLGSLQQEERILLRAASIFGGTFWAGGAALLTGEPIARVEARLRRLEDRELTIRRPTTRFSGEAEHAFRHAFVHQTAHAMLTAEDAMLGHRLAGEWLVAHGEEEPLVLAEHFERGAVSERAIGYFARAAEQALESHAFAEAIARAERGVRCGAEGQELGALRLVQAEAQRWRSESADAARSSEEAWTLLTPGSARAFDALWLLILSCSRMGQHERVEQLCRSLLDASGDELARARAMGRAARACFLLGSSLGDALLAQAGRSASAGADVLGAILNARAMRARLDGDAGQSAELSAQAAQSFERAGDPRQACSACVNTGLAMLELGLYEQAETSLRLALSDAVKMGLVYVAAAARLNLGLVLGHLGRLDEALAEETQAVAAFDAQRDLRMEGAARIYLAEIHLLRGELDRALEEARTAALRLDAFPPVLPHALGALAHVLLVRGEPSEALARAEQARASLDEHPVEEGEALVRLVYAEALQAAGSDELARGAMAAAHERLLARALRISGLEHREAFLRRVPEHARTLELAAAWGNAQR